MPSAIVVDTMIASAWRKWPMNFSRIACLWHDEDGDQPAHTR